MAQFRFEERAKTQLQLINTVIRDLSTNGIHVHLASARLYKVLKEQQKEIRRMLQIHQLIRVIGTYTQALNKK